MAWLSRWEPEDPQFWKETGSTIAWTTLIVTTISLIHWLCPTTCAVWRVMMLWCKGLHGRSGSCWMHRRWSGSAAATGFAGRWPAEPDTGGDHLAMIARGALPPAGGSSGSS